MYSAMPSRNLRPIAPKPGLSEGGWSPRRINLIAEFLPNPQKYLEIGVRYGTTIENVKITKRWGVDPRMLCRADHLPRDLSLYEVTSDEFFAQLGTNELFDLVYLDGLHDWHQTFRDLIHALRHTRAGSVILLDDVVPVDKHSALPTQELALAARRLEGLTGTSWHGDVFKVMFAIRDFLPNLAWCVIDSKLGNPQAILWRRSVNPQEELPDPNLIPHHLYRHLKYETVFVNGEPPAFFNTMSEVSALACVRHGVMAHLDKLP